MSAPRPAQPPQTLPVAFCWYCGVRTQATVEGRPDFATRDHVVPRSRNGSGARNYVAACRGCNTKKGDLFLDDFRKQLGGGLFWGELFSNEVVPGTIVRARHPGEFRVWLDIQATEGRHYWFAKARAAGVLRGFILEPERTQADEATRTMIADALMRELEKPGQVGESPTPFALTHRGAAPSSRSPSWHLRKAVAVAIYAIAWRIDPEGGR